MRNFGTLIIITGIFFNLACQSGGGFVEDNTAANVLEDSTFHAEDSMVPAEQTPATEITMAVIPMTPITEITMTQAPRQQVAQVAELTATYNQHQRPTFTTNNTYENFANLEAHVEVKPVPHREHATKDDLILGDSQDPTDDD